MLNIFWILIFLPKSYLKINIFADSGGNSAKI